MTTKFNASSPLAQGSSTDDQEDCPKVNVTQKIDSPVRAAQQYDPETTLELVLRPTGPFLQRVKGKEVISDQETPSENAKSDNSDTTMKSHANVQGMFGGESVDLQLGLKPSGDHEHGPITRARAPPSLSASSSPSKKKKPLHTPINYIEKAKMKSVMMKDEYKSLHQVPSFMPSNLIRTPDAKGKRAITWDDNLISSRAHDQLRNNNVLKRAKEFSDEMLATVLVELLKQMPMVSTNGGVPDGKITKGFLFKYQRGATIVCGCHGEFFTSAEFVKHAGGNDVENPSRFINIEFFPNN